ncbi:MAG: hypothetical protein ABI045_01585 [Flavobacteriales bacterium]
MIISKPSWKSSSINWYDTTPLIFKKPIVPNDIAGITIRPEIYHMDVQLFSVSDDAPIIP